MPKINLGTYGTCMKTVRSILEMIVIYIFTINAFVGPYHKVHIIESNELPLKKYITFNNIIFIN